LLVVEKVALMVVLMVASSEHAQVVQMVLNSAAKMVVKKVLKWANELAEKLDVHKVSVMVARSVKLMAGLLV
jgi:hypothetical protein